MGQRVAETFTLGMVLLLGTRLLPGCTRDGEAAGAAIAADEAANSSTPTTPSPATKESAPSPQELVKRLIQADPSQLNDSLNAVAAQRDAAVVPLLKNLTEANSDRVLQAIERIELQRQSSKDAKAPKWESSPLVTSLGYDSEDVRRAAMTALQVLYPKLPDRLGLILALRESRQESTHWDVISLLPDVLESFAIIELREISALPARKAGQDPAAPHEERLVAIGDPARLEILQTIALLDPTSQVSNKELEVQMRRQAREDRWRRQKAVNRYYVPPPDAAFQKESKELEALKADADKKYAIIDGLTATSETLWLKRNLEFLEEARPLVPDPTKVTADHARSDRAVADIMLTAGETLLANWEQQPKAARLLYDAMLMTRGGNVPRPFPIACRNASAMAVALNSLDPDAAARSHQGVLDQIEAAIAKGGKDAEAMQKMLPLAVMRAAFSAYQRSDLPLALQLQIRTVGLLEESAGAESLDVGSAISQLAAVQAASGDQEAAIKTYRRAIDILKSLRPQADTRLVDAISGLCSALIRVGRAAEAQDLVLHYLNDFRKTPGETHLQTVRLVSERGRCLLALEKPEEAEEAARRSIAAMTSLNKGEALPASGAHEILGEILWTRGQKEEARSEWQTSLRIRRKWTGDLHPAARRVAARLHETTQP